MASRVHEGSEQGRVRRSVVVARAERFAERRHRGLLARDGRTPYIAHVQAVARLVDEAGASNRLLAATYLHDLVEHTSTTIVEIRARFGVRIAELVDWASIPTHGADGVPIAWAAQKREALRRAADGRDEMAWLRAADVCVNAGELVRGYASSGPSVWTGYTSTPASQLGYYLALIELLQARIDNDVLRERLEATRDALHELAASEGVVPCF